MLISLISDPVIPPAYKMPEIKPREVEFKKERDAEIRSSLVEFCKARTTDVSLPDLTWPYST